MNNGIYTITNKVTNKIYIGRAIDFYNRESTHFSLLKYNKHTNLYLQEDFNHYGEENFIFEILEECNENFMASQENYWCNMLNTHDRKYGYNIAPTSPDKEIRRNKESIERARLKQIGQKRSEECKNRLRIAKLNQSEETKRKISESHKGKKQILHYVPVLQFTKDGTFIKEYESMVSAQKETGITYPQISRVCSGKYHNRTMAGGFIWKYKIA
jgi:group I intron endonuclease